MSASALLDARQLAVGYSARVVATDINFVVSPGQALAVLGPNGAGKTTLFRTLLGLLPPRGGEILLDANPIAALTPSEIAARIAYVPQSGANHVGFSVIDIVEMARAPHLAWYATPGQRDRALAMQTLERLGIASFAKRPFAELSGGERQLVLIARALCAGARCLLLDEPSASLDFGNRLHLQDALLQLKSQGVALIFTTHEPQQAKDLASEATDGILTISREGRAQLLSPSDALRAETLQLLYNVDARMIARSLQLRD